MEDNTLAIMQYSLQKVDLSLRCFRLLPAFRQGVVVERQVAALLLGVSSPLLLLLLLADGKGLLQRSGAAVGSRVVDGRRRRSKVS